MRHFYTFCLVLFCIFLTNKKIQPSLTEKSNESSSTNYSPQTTSSNSSMPKTQLLQSRKRKRSECEYQDLKSQILEEHAHLREYVLQEFCKTTGINLEILKKKIAQKIIETSVRDDQYPLSDYNIPVTLKPDRISEYGLRRIFAYFGVHDSYVAIQAQTERSNTEKINISDGVLTIIAPNFYRLPEAEQNAYLLASIATLKYHSTETLETMLEELEINKENIYLFNKAHNIIQKYHTLCREQANAEALLIIATDPYHPLKTKLSKALAVYKKIEESLQTTKLCCNLDDLVKKLKLLAKKENFCPSSSSSIDGDYNSLYLLQTVNNWQKNIEHPNNNTIEELPDCDAIYDQKIDPQEENTAFNAWIQKIK